MNESMPTRDELVELICARLAGEEAQLAKEFADSAMVVGVRHCAIDNLLPKPVALAIAAHFPAIDQMRLMDSFREKKFTSKNFEKFHPLIEDITFAIQHPRVVAVVERITGIKDQIPDPSLYAGGLSAMVKGHFLGVHIDNSHESSRRYYRTLNLLYYVTPHWQQSFGGHLQLWDRDVTKSVAIQSAFNRLVLMETHPWSWHSVNAVVAEGVRRCVSNYYFSPTSPTGRDYFNVTSFSAPRDQPVRRLLTHVDARLRQLMRAIVPGGLGKKDVYEGRKS